MAAQRIVIKIGSSSLVNGEGQLAIDSLRILVQQLAQLRRLGKEVVLVSSGAVACGSGQLCLKQNFVAYRKQILSAIGQSHLMQHYHHSFQQEGVPIAQVLLIRQDLEDRQLYLNARSTLLGLIEHQIIPIANENDVVAATSFGGNDMLAAAIAGLIDADELLILTDIDGVYDRSPDQIDAKRFATLEAHELDALLHSQNRTSTFGKRGSAHGTGGMQTKLEAALLASQFGVRTVIGHASNKEGILELLNTAKKGTQISPSLSPLEARKRWLRFGVALQGKITVDEGAETALRAGTFSLLPVGVKKVEGVFSRGDAVKVFNQAGKAVAVGLVEFSAEEAQTIQGKNTAQIQSIYPERPQYVMIHRDDLVLC